MCARRLLERKTEREIKKHKTPLCALDALTMSSPRSLARLEVLSAQQHLASKQKALAVALAKVTELEGKAAEVGRW